MEENSEAWIWYRWAVLQGLLNNKKKTEVERRCNSILTTNMPSTNATCSTNLKDKEDLSLRMNKVFEVFVENYVIFPNWQSWATDAETQCHLSLSCYILIYKGQLNQPQAQQPSRPYLKWVKPLWDRNLPYIIIHVAQFLLMAHTRLPSTDWRLKDFVKC